MADDLPMAVVERQEFELLGDACPGLRLVMGPEQRAEIVVPQAHREGQAWM